MRTAYRASGKDNRAGFTIIEILIALTVAGMILMVVFEAIPTLIRSSRNHQRNQDVQSILAAVSHWELNNSGNLPTRPQLDNFLAQYGKLTYYDPTRVFVTLTPATDSVGVYGSTNNLDDVIVWNHAKCDFSHFGQGTNAGAGYSDVIALYATESNNPPAIAPKCQQL